MSAVAPMLRRARPNVTRKLGRRRFAAVLVIGVEHRHVVDVVVLQGHELAVTRRADANPLLGTRAMSD